MTEPMTVVDALRELRALLEDPDRWVIGVMACDGDGDLVDPDDPAACRWCLVGAVEKVTGCDVAAACDVMGALAGRLPVVVDEPYSPVATDFRSRLESFNDSRTHTQVLALIRSALGTA